MRALSGKYIRLCAVCVLAAFGAAAGPRWSSPEVEAQLRDELSAMLADAEVRYPGSSGNLAMEQYVSDRFAASGMHHGEMRFPAPAFVPGTTTLTLEGREPIDLLAMHPSLLRPGNFTERDFVSRLVYLGRGGFDDLERLSGVDLEGALGVLEFDSGNEWINWLRFGVKGFVFLEPEVYDRHDALSKVYSTEVAVPRFLVQGEDVSVLREAAEGESVVRINAEPSRWANSELRNLWVFIPGSDPVLSLEEFKDNPPGRSILLAAVNGHTQCFKGERVLAWNMMAPRTDLESLRDTINNDLRYNQAILSHYAPLNLEKVRPEDEATFIRWRYLVDDTTGRNISVKEPLVRLAKREVNRIKSEKLLLRLSDVPETEQQRLLDDLDRRQEMYINILVLFNKVGRRTVLSEMTPAEMDIIRGFIDEIIQDNTTRATLNELELEMDLRNTAVRNILRGKRVSFVVSLDADWTSDSLGFSVGSDTGRSRWSTMWGVNTSRIARELNEASGGGKSGLLIDSLSLRGGLTEEYYFNLEAERRGGVLSPALVFHACANTPAFSLRNTFTDYGRAFLPSDTVENLDSSKFAEGMAFLPQFWRAVLDDRYITTSSQLARPKGTSMNSMQVKTFKFDELSASVFPDIPVPGTAVILRPNYGTWSTYLPFRRDAIKHGDVINADIALTDMRASTVFYGLTRSSAGSMATAAFQYDDDFVKILHTIDAGEIQNKVDSNRVADDLTMALFKCEEFPLYTMSDPSRVASLPINVYSIMPLTARGNSSPRKFGLTGVMSPLSSKLVNASPGAPAAFYFDGLERIKLVTLEKRVALNATPENPEGKGYLHPDEFGRDFFRVVARDLSTLNHARLKQLRDVADDLVREFLDRGDEARARSEEARAQNDHLGYLRGLYESLGAQVKSYQQSKQTTDDMLKAVVVYMALLLPFCFFIQKLLFNFVKIEKEMGMFALLFLGTFLIFRLIHPAFRVAQAAEAIFIAFVMGALGLFVISILRGRFEGEMQLLFRSFQGNAMDDEVGYSTVTQKAMLIGVNNMKRRRVRTILTTATIVLIAFTMLSFTSISKKVNPTMLSRSRQAPYTGMMYHWPGRATMDQGTLNVVKNLFAGNGQFVVRRWWTSSFATGWAQKQPMPARLERLKDGSDAQIEGILGISLEEDGFIEALPLMHGRNFSSEDAGEVMLFASTANVLGINEDDLDQARVRIMGRELKVVGILDDVLFRTIRDINDLPLQPINRLETDSGDQTFNPVVATKSSPTEDIHDMGALFFVETSSLLLVPNGVAERMGAEPYSISLRLNPDQDLWKMTDLMLTATDARFYIASEQPFKVGADSQQTFPTGTYYIGSSYSTSIGGLAALIIPLIIASTIILNTMLGSVYERKKEIAVYNAVGLNPHHIGMFFLAESFVYGVIGSVGGYLIGQVLSIVVSHFGLVQGINFNYSSLSVAYVILFTIAIVLLSTLYPATVATRAAVPSGKRKWSLPPREGNSMNVVFPFIYTPQIAPGIISYLHEYFSRFTAASIGDLIATPESHSRGKDEQGRDFYLLNYHLALAPYDLGVTQHLRFRLAFDDKVQSYRLAMRIERISGQDNNWITTN
ncbi:MAG: ABC transporter permease, partial [Lentisphaerae bacterium]|nr:ABC transporter permease [Lentisphaerota bacterium]